jgi:hypothetical protein
VQAHADPDGADLAPAFPVQRTLRRQRSGKGVVGVLEYRAEPIAQRMKNMSVMRSDRVLQQRIVTGERRLHGLRMLLEEPGRAFDVGEEKGDGAAGQSTHDA